MKAGNANCDTLTGTHALNAALIGLIQARKTGEGCRVDIGMMDTVMISCGETVVCLLYTSTPNPIFIAYKWTQDHIVAIICQTGCKTNVCRRMK